MDSISSFIWGILINLFLFVIPVILYLKLKDKVNPLVYLKIRGNSKQGILIAIIVSSTFIILLITKNAITGFNSFHLNLGVLWISGLLAGFVEEIPFRGFILQKLWNHMKFWKANLLTTIIFVLSHMPVWINSNTDIIRSAINISMVSLALGYLFKEYKSLWIPIICHSVFNLCIWMGL
ncbi:CAAX amino terminal protease self- immunity [Clostridium puniceum]|uniref:CAAX amino terminal protease self-immunity n=1 Tax=Clostridium puniceum TaxID=29367 RepID=A0A1S8TPE0_9CLOT|nr:CPBP family intramembrane glutamic endopeptidase [Clostridium puniceum]OOM79586.1 CAAX amino terminal protease self- immunity [Clostridium puniceum]